jgi:hypothetical protein
VSALNLQIDPAALLPVIEAAVSATLARLESERAALNGKLAYPEAEAARLLSLKAHQLRDCRLRGEITASVGPGRKILYSRQDLTNFLLSRRWKSER